MKCFINLLKSFTLIVFLPYIIYGAGGVKGTVTDSATDSPLFGANVILMGTSLGSAVNIDGEYIIKGVPAGSYSVKCSYIGYKSQTFEVTVMDNRTVELDFQLVLDVVEGEEVIITAQAQGQAAAINQQLRSNTITNIVSLDKILEIPDANAAESVGRLPGVSILRDGGEGNKVTIRGLAPTYNAVTIGGVTIPSTDLNDRSVDMSMISPEILAGIEVTKALTPDKDADALGGTVDFKLATAPAGGFRVNVRSQSGYNDQRDEFGQYKSSISISNRFLDNKLGVLITGNAERTQRGYDEFGAGYANLREKREGEEFAPQVITGVSFRHVIDVRERFGFNILLDYDLPFGKIKSSNFFSRLDRNEQQRRRRWDVGSNYQRYYWRERDRQLDIMTNTLGAELDFDFFEMDFNVSRSQSNTRYPFDNYIQVRQSGGFEQGVIDATTVQELFDLSIIKLEDTHLYLGSSATDLSLERNHVADFDVKVPFNFTNWLAGTLKFGGKYRSKYKERDEDYQSRRLDSRNGSIRPHHTRWGEPGFTFETNPGSGWPSILNYIDDDFDAGDFLNGQYEFGLGLNGEELNHLFNTYLADSNQVISALADIDDFELDEEVASGFIMTEINLGQTFMLLPGVRYESTNLNMTGRRGNVPSETEEEDIEDPFVFDTTSTASYDNWFPMVHLRIKPTEWMDLRLAYTESISRPQLNWMLPKIRIDGSNQSVTLSRPDLKPQLSTNYDAYLSIYGNEVGLLTIGGFYKDIKDLVYMRAGRKLLDPVSEGYEENWKGLTMNAPENSPFKTEVYGFEIEWQTNFRWLPSPFNGIVININYTHIWSETKYPRSRVESTQIPTFPFILTEVIDTFRVGNMINQPDDIANISVGYDYGPFMGRVSMLYQGKTLRSIGERVERDQYTKDYIRWDFLAKYNLTDNISFYFNLNNFTNTPDESYVFTERYLTEQEYYSWTADLGIGIKLN